MIFRIACETVEESRHALENPEKIDSRKNHMKHIYFTYQRYVDNYVKTFEINIIRISCQFQNVCFCINIRNFFSPSKIVENVFEAEIILTNKGRKKKIYEKTQNPWKRKAQILERETRSQIDR